MGHLCCRSPLRAAASLSRLSNGREGLQSAGAEPFVTKGSGFHPASPAPGLQQQELSVLGELGTPRQAGGTQGSQMELQVSLQNEALGFIQGRARGL